MAILAVQITVPASTNQTVIGVLGPFAPGVKLVDFSITHDFTDGFPDASFQATIAPVDRFSMAAADVGDYRAFASALELMGRQGTGYHPFRIPLGRQNRYIACVMVVPNGGIAAPFHIFLNAAAVPEEGQDRTLGNLGPRRAIAGH